MGDITEWLLASQDPFDPDGDEYPNNDEEGEWGGRQPSQPRCKYCGSTDVRWRQQGGRWVLFSSRPGVVHDCRSSAAADSEFEPL